MRKVFLTLLAAVMPSPAAADMTATYVAPNAFSMTIEVSDNGDVRGDAGQPGAYFVTRAGQGYFIQTRESRLIVMRVEDIATVMAEQMAALDPQFREQMRDHAPVLKLVAKGEKVINGRSGAAYFMQGDGDQISAVPVAVISNDPKLAPLGKAMSRQFEMSMTMMSRTMPTDAFKGMADVLKTGAPLLFSGAQLKSVVYEPVARSRFDLPASPASVDEVRTAMVVKRAKP